MNLLRAARNVSVLRSVASSRCSAKATRHTNRHMYPFLSVATLSILECNWSSVNTSRIDKGKLLCDSDTWQVGHELMRSVVSLTKTSDTVVGDLSHQVVCSNYPISFANYYKQCRCSRISFVMWCALGSNVGCLTSSGN